MRTGGWIALLCSTLILALIWVGPVPIKAASNIFPPSPIFTQSPLDPEAVRAIIPLGNLNPAGGHVFPTDHMYFDYGQKAGLVVVAPAAGTVLAIRGQSREDFKIEIRADENLCYYLGHLFVESGIQVGSPIKAGMVLGRASARSWLDLGVHDRRVRLAGFVNPARYPLPTLHAVSPLALFSEPLKSQFYAKVKRAGPDQDGKIDFDRPGYLVGNWFHQSLSLSESSRGEPGIWARQLAFAYDVHSPTVVRISIGGTVAPPGIYAVPLAMPDPARVGMANGLVKYQVLNPGQSSTGNTSRLKPGVLLVQLLGENKLKAEYFPGKIVDEVKDFTRAASVYER